MSDMPELLRIALSPDLGKQYYYETVSLRYGTEYIRSDVVSGWVGASTRAYHAEVARAEAAEAKIAAVKKITPLPLEFPQATTTYSCGYNEALEDVRAVLEGK